MNYINNYFFIILLCLTVCLTVYLPVHAMRQRKPTIERETLCQKKYTQKALPKELQQDKDLDWSDYCAMLTLCCAYYTGINRYKRIVTRQHN